MFPLTPSLKGFHQIISACPGEISLVPRDTPCIFWSFEYYVNLSQMDKILIAGHFTLLSWRQMLDFTVLVACQD